MTDQPATPACWGIPVPVRRSTVGDATSRTTFPAGGGADRRQPGRWHVESRGSPARERPSRPSGEDVHGEKRGVPDRTADSQGKSQGGEGTGGGSLIGALTLGAVIAWALGAA